MSKTAEEIYDAILKREKEEWSYTDVIEAMKEYAEQEMEKAFKAGQQKTTINMGDRHKDRYVQISLYNSIEEYKQQNPLK